MIDPKRAESAADRAIVVAVDRSLATTAAVEWAAGEALLHGRRLVLVHATTPVIVDTHDPVLRARIQRWRIYCAKELLADAKTQLIEHTALGSDAISTSLHLTQPVKLLADMSESAWMIVLGSRFHESVGGRRWGSVSAALCYRAKCPVTVVHSHHPGHITKPVLVGIDGSEASDRAAAVAFDEASRRGVGVVAVHAWSDDHVPQLIGADWDRYHAGAEDALRRSLTGIRALHPDVAVTQ